MLNFVDGEDLTLNVFMANLMIPKTKMKDVHDNFFPCN